MRWIWLGALYKRVIGLNVHQAQITACALIEQSVGTTRMQQRQFGGFKRDRRDLAEWAQSLHPDEVVMESTDIYWKSPPAVLEALGMRAKVVNARHVRNVPGRKRTWAKRTGWRNTGAGARTIFTFAVCCASSLMLQVAPSACSSRSPSLCSSDAGIKEPSWRSPTTSGHLLLHAQAARKLPDPRHRL